MAEVFSSRRLPLAELEAHLKIVEVAVSYKDEWEPSYAALVGHINALTVAEHAAGANPLPDDPTHLADVLRGPKACEAAIIEWHEKASARDISDPLDDLDAFWSCFESVLQGLLASGKPLLQSIEAATAVAAGLHVP